MVPAHQNIWDNHASIIIGTRVLRIFEKARRKTIILVTRLLANHFWNQAYCSINHGHSCQFPTSQDIVSQGNLICHQGLNALIIALIVTTDKDQFLFLSQIFSVSLIELLSSRIEENDARIFLFNSIKGIENGLGSEQHPLTASVGLIIYMTGLFSIFSEIMILDIQEPFFTSLSND